MEAKDTVMMPIQIESVLKPLFPINDCQQCETAIAEAQAEISYKAGLREVAEFLNSHRWQGHKSVGFDSPKGYLVDEEKWQAKLKEWGIK